MATQTTHYNLTKPGLTDPVDVIVLNDNADIIDDAIYAASQSGGATMIESSVEATTTSAHAYAVGDHFIYNNTLYAVTAAIAIGDTITPDTNCVATTVAGELEGKVDKVPGKQLSTEDYTTAEKEKLEGIAAGAEVNVQSDWNQADSTADDYIKNRTHYAVPAWTQKISADLHPISGESMRKLCGQGTAGVQTLTNGKLYKVTLGTKVWTGYPTKYTWTAYEYAYVLETDIGLTFEDEYNDPSWAGWKAYITTGSTVDWYAHLTIEENSGENVTKLDNKYLDMDSAPASGSAKPVTSGGVYTALTGKISTTAKGAANGVASLDSSGKVPSGQLPSYVDDVIEGYYYNGAFYSDSAHTQEITGETGKIYVDLSTEDSYRWSGSVYVKIANQIKIDATLTHQGEAADAKATGDAVSELRNTLNQLETDTFGNINLTGTNNTGSTITAGTFFYNNGSLVRAKTDIQNGSAITIGTNAETVTAGGLNELNNNITTEIEKRLFVDKRNATSYQIPLNGKDAGAFWFALMYTATASSAFSVYSIFVNSNNSSVVISKMLGSDIRNYTGSVSGSVLTITVNDNLTVWAGIRVIKMN